MRLIRSFLIAFSTYSRIPVPQVEWTEENRRYAMCFFPLIGAVLGLILWGWLALCDALQFGAFLRGEYRSHQEGGRVRSRTRRRGGR